MSSSEDRNRRPCRVLGCPGLLGDAAGLAHLSLVAMAKTSMRALRLIRGLCETNTALTGCLSFESQTRLYCKQFQNKSIPRGRGFLEAKILEAKDKAKLEFPGGGEVQNETPSVEGGWIFSGNAQWI